MRIAIASSNNGGLDDMVSPQFGRCPAFTIIDVDDGEIKNVHIIPNPGVNAPSGAGVQAAQMIIDEGCMAVIAGNIGPNSFQILSLQRVDIREAPPVRVEEALHAYLSNQLPPASGRGRFGGMGRGGYGRGRGRGRGMRGGLNI